MHQDEWLLRRSYATPERKYMNPDGTAHSRVFKLRPKDNGELSVDVKSLTTIESAIIDFQKFILFETANQEVISMGLKTFHDIPDDWSNPAHAVIVGMSEDDEILPGKLARKSRRLRV